MLERTGHNNPDGSFNWRDALADAAITAGVTFFSSLGGSSLFGSDPLRACGAAAIAAAGQFFIFLAIKRGLRERSE